MPDEHRNKKRSDDIEDRIRHRIFSVYFFNPDFFTDVKRVSKSLKLLTNVGNIKSNMADMFENLESWFNSESIANVLSLSHVSSKHQVFFGCAEENGPHAKTGKGWINFRLNSKGLFVYDVRDDVNKFCIKSKNKLKT